MGQGRASLSLTIKQINERKQITHTCLLVYKMRLVIDGVNHVYVLVLFVCMYDLEDVYVPTYLPNPPWVVN